MTSHGKIFSKWKSGLFYEIQHLPLYIHYKPWLVGESGLNMRVTYPVSSFQIKNKPRSNIIHVAFLSKLSVVFVHFTHLFTYREYMLEYISEATREHRSWCHPSDDVIFCVCDIIGWYISVLVCWCQSFNVHNLYNIQNIQLYNFLHINICIHVLTYGPP